MQRIFLLPVIFALAISCIARGQDSWEEDFKTSPTPGQRTFTSTCAGCHGLDGHGSEKAPNIANSARVRHLTDAQLSAVITNGVPGSGMPAFHALNSKQIQSLVRFVRALEGQSSTRYTSGDAARGKKIFFGKGDCASCHSISGNGGFFGPDLTGFAGSASADEIRNAVVSPPRMSSPGYKRAAVTTRGGERIEGVVRNEDNFSVQMQTSEGAFLFFQKNELQNLEYLSESLMPSDYGKRLSSAEITDLIRYLVSTGTSSKTSHESHQRSRSAE